MSDIILLQPGIEIYSLLSSSPPGLPLGLMSLARLLDKKYKVKIIDQRIDKNWKKSLIKELKTKPLCVGTTASTGREVYNALEISNFVKKNSPKTKIVWGGVHASLFPNQTLDNENIDMIIKGEGEETFYELVRSLDKKGRVDGIKGLWYKDKNNKVYSNHERAFLDLNKLPELPYWLVDVKRYVKIREGKRTLYLETSRGCPYNCSFCYNKFFHKNTWRALKPEKVIKQIEYLKKNYNIESLWIVDDNFFVDKKRVISIARGLIKKQLNVYWSSLGVHINDLKRFNLKELGLLRKSGCKNLAIGAESGSDKILKEINKHITIKDILGINILLKKAKIKPLYYFMVGFPNETRKDLKKTLKLVLRLLKENNNIQIGDITSYTPVNNEDCKINSLEEWALYDRTLHINRKKRRLIKRINFWAQFLDDKLGYYCDRKVICFFLKILSLIYIPLSRRMIKSIAERLNLYKSK